jgi:peptide/nickel transport system substrate-binding protein
MRSRLGAKLTRFLAIAALAAAGLVPGVASAQTDDLILRVGTDQELVTLNPWNSYSVADYEMFQVQYELLVSFDINLQPTAGFADDWDTSEDGMTHTFHIREGMLWSDGTPATCEDAEYSWGTVLRAVEEGESLGSDYLPPYLTNAGLASVSCDGADFIATTEFPTTLLTQAYVPILPKHIWEGFSLGEIGDESNDNFFMNEPPVVGSGPYVATDWVPGEFIRMERNPNYWGTPGVPDAIIYEQFESTDTMVQALRNGELDYVRGVGPDQFDQLETEENIRVAEGYSNGYTYLSFNTRGNSGGYNGSTSALADVAFRDALGFALDRQELVDRVLSGHGVPGTTHVPPYHQNWHVEPDNPRTFNIAEANARLDAAGYDQRSADGIRLDKEGKPILLRLTWPHSEDHSQDAQFIQGWFEQIGIGVDPFVTRQGKLYRDLAGPEAGGEANWDFYMWGWVGDPDPMSLLSFFVTEEIETTINDCFYSNPEYDQLFKDQQRATDVAERQRIIAEMQQMFYDDACYHILYYDSDLHAMRTDKFTGWTNQPPDSGVPIFGYGYPGYMVIQDASAQPTAGPATAAPSLAPGVTAGPATPAPSGAPTGGSGGDSTPLIIGAIVLILVIAGGFWFMRRQTPAVEEE